MPEAFVPDKPVRVKITNPDGSWSKATLARVPDESEITEGEKYEILDEPGSDVYGVLTPPEYGKTEPAQAQPAQAGAKAKEADK
jgi:hypothetical protein